MAFKLLREGLLLAGLLSNSESWINPTKLDIEQLEKPDTILQRKCLATSGNPSMAFIMLELGIIPIKYMTSKKCLLFFQYILKEEKESMVIQLFQVQQNDSRKRDFVNLSSRDREELEIV